MFRGTNQQVERDQTLTDLSVGRNSSLPIFNILPSLSYQKRGSIAFDDLFKTLAVFDGLVWTYLYSGGITDITNIGTGAQVFESFNPNLPDNKVARFRSFIAGTGMSISQTPTTIIYTLDASLGELNNVNANVDSLANNNFLSVRGGDWRSVSLVLDSPLSLVNNLTQTILSLVTAKGFHAVLADDITLTDGNPDVVIAPWVSTPTQVPPNPIVYNDGGEFVDNTGIYTVPIDSVYHISAVISHGLVDPGEEVVLVITVLITPPVGTVMNYQTRKVVTELDGFSVGVLDLSPLLTAGTTVRLMAGCTGTQPTIDIRSRIIPNTAIPYTWFSITPVVRNNT